jgi:RNA polymerase sigma factor (sigma-70 family)
LTTTTARIHDQIQRMRSGDATARDELLRDVSDRLERLARRMMKDYPRVRRWADSNDVLQNASMRLLRALEKLTPGSTREFFALAAVQIRRELIDLARHYAGPRGLAPPTDDSAEPAAPEREAVLEPDLDRWTEFHLAVDRLPAKEREVVSLIHYHGWEQAQIAELFGVDERTVRRWQQSALAQLSEAVGGELET